MVREWQEDYNEERPHAALYYQSPKMYFKTWMDRELKSDYSNPALSTSANGGPNKPQVTPIVDKVFGKPKDDLITKTYF